MNFRKLSVTAQILIALVAGIVLGLLANHFGFQNLVRNWISPFGQLFIQALKLVAMPLIIVSLLSGFTDLNDLSKLSRMGGRTVLAYLITTVLAVSIGLVLGNSIRPGAWISEETRNDLMTQAAVIPEAPEAQEPSMRFLLDLVPENFLDAASDNRNMLQVILVTLLFAIATIRVSEPSRLQLASLFRSLNEVVMKVIDYIMLMAPVGVFALMANVVVEAPRTDLMVALLGYALSVVLGLAILVFLVYPLGVRWFGGMAYPTFIKGILPAQLLAISTSSSAATLPVTMECVEENLKVDPDVASFVLPIGATINMDGTSLYQAVAVLFIAQAFGMELSFSAQLMVVVTATLASIGAAAVPGAGILMLTIVLEQVGVPLAGLALILAIDRPLDMLRTSVNVTSDAAIATVIHRSVHGR